MEAARTMTNRAVTHEMVLVPRERNGQRVAVRKEDGMRWVEAAGAGPLSAQVCEVCGYGPTDLQREPLESGRGVMHRATPLPSLPR